MGSVLAASIAQLPEILQRLLELPVALLAGQG